MPKDKDVTEPLTQRERIALAVLLAIIKVVKPAGWSHEVNAMTKQINKEVGLSEDD